MASFLMPFALLVLLVLVRQTNANEELPPNLRFGMMNGGSSFFEPIYEAFSTKCNQSGIALEYRLLPNVKNCSCVCRRTQFVEEMIELGVDAIAMKPCGAEESIPFIALAHEAGIPLVTFDSDSPNSTRIAHVGTDNWFLGRTMARLLRQLRPEGGQFAVIGEKAGRTDGFIEEITKHNGNEDESRAPWFQFDLNVSAGGPIDFMDIMEMYAPYNLSAYVSFKQTPMKHPNWTAFVDRNPAITYIGTDNAEFQLEYLNRRYVDGLVGQLPYEIGLTAFQVLSDYLQHQKDFDEGKTTKEIELQDFYPTNLVAYNLIPLDLPPLDVDENLLGNLKYVGFICFGVVAISALLCVVWTIKYRRDRVVKAAQPFFLFMVAGGVVLLSSALIPLSFEDDGLSGFDMDSDTTFNVGICMSVPWLAFLGLTITFSALFSKTWRVNRLFHSKGRHARVQVAEQDVLAPFGVMMTANIVVLTCWTIFDPLTYTRQFEAGTDYWNREIASYGACRSDNSAAFLAPLAVVNLSCVAIACWQAYEARSIKSEFAETKYIGLAMFSLFQAFLTGIPVVSVVKDLPQTYYFVLTLMIFLLSVVVLGLIFIPKVLMLHNYAGMTDAEQKKRMESSVALSANPSRGFQRRPTHDGGNGGESGNTAASLRKIPQYSPSTNSAGDMSTGFIKSVSFKANRLSPNHEETSGLPKLYPLSQIKNVTNSLEFAPQLIDAISRGFVDYQYGKFNAAPIQTLGAPPTMAPFVKVEGYQSQTCVKSGYFEGYPYFVVKVASGGYPMTNSGSVQLYSQQSGEMECLLFDRGLLTELRTAAVGALAAKLLAPKVINKIGMLGTGVQARYQLDYLQHVTTCRNVLVWGRSNSSSLDAFVADVRSQGWSVEVAKEPNDLLKDCELVVTTTSSREAILQNCNENEERSAWKVRLITCIGADAPGKMELDPKLVNSAAMLVADSIQQTVERGEFQHWCQMGSASKDKILPLGQVIENQDLHRHEQDDGLVIFDSSGVALQDAVIAQMVYTVLNDDARPSIKEEPAPYLPPSVVVPVENVSNVPARSIHEACIIDSQIDSRSNSQGIQSIPRTTESTEVHE